MTGFDYAILVIIGISVLLGLSRGLVGEVLRIVAWVAAWWIAKHFTGPILPLLPAMIPPGEVRASAAFVLTFILALIALSILAKLVSQTVRAVGLGLFDRVLGGAFGMLRGTLIVLLLVLFAGLTTLPSQLFWQQAKLSPFLEKIALWAKMWLPEEMAAHIHYNKDKA